ncbi:hypothetical protein KVR01_004998 [Diaporthe batatas]|uniref:uncharacterized protein n=1 Tax=Diaporthe batatas TaxID=748121 RepID=UPI001D05A92E|nr:uncharacterized protein KVR01_004998 [Diaporthe batatas]KAG8164723.1 hypothetical protein KVR01_004998 [Diaporthe batatas]
MEPLIASPHRDGSPAVAAPAFIPVKISASGALVLDPGQTQDAYMKRLQKLVHSSETLEKAGYVVQPLTQFELGQKKKCARCHKFVFKKAFKHTLDGEPKQGSGAVVASSSTDAVGNAASRGGRSKQPPANGSKNGSKKDCRYHSGHFNGRTWGCCGGGAWNQPCTTADDHEVVEYKPGELEGQYRYHRTPAEAPGSAVRRAVAIDCEMGTSIRNESICIRVSAVDYFTAEVLVDQLVFPDEKILNYNTRFSGVTFKQMMQAKSKGDCLLGIAAARRALWNFVGPDTIVVAHSGQNDLTCLRWIHAKIVDTFLVEASPVMKLEKEAREEAARQKELAEKLLQEAAAKEQSVPAETNSGQTVRTQKQPGHQKPAEKPAEKPKRKGRGGSGRFSLKTLTKERIGKDIQTGREGHDSVKDAVATRDVAHWNVLNFGHGFYEIETPSS